LETHRQPISRCLTANGVERSERTPGEEERITEVLRLAGLWEVVETLPDGIDTVVGAGFGGVADLSGGQWQRLALARLLYHDAPLPRADLPPGFVLRCGVHGEALEHYQELHRAVFDGTRMSFWIVRLQT
jgi:hypothetical protein